MDVTETKRFAIEIRKETIKCIGHAGVGHLGGSLSICDLLAVLYGGEMNVDPDDPQKDDRDFLIVSKGHAGPAVYAALALRGFFPMEWLDTLNQGGTHLPSHCDMSLTPGIDMTTGSLGQGASAAMGIALGNRMKGYEDLTFLILGDGEIEEGQVWEAAMFASAKKLDHVIAFVDANKYQIDDSVDSLCALGDIAKKFEDFGWYAQNVEDGNDVEQIKAAIDKARANVGSGIPSMIVLNTIKGQGYSRIAGTVGSHSVSLTPEMVDEALAELDEALAALERRGSD